MTTTIKLTDNEVDELLRHLGIEHKLAIRIAKTANKDYRR